MCILKIATHSGFLDLIKRKKEKEAVGFPYKNN